MKALGQEKCTGGAGAACGPGWGRVSMALSAREREEIVDGLPAREGRNQTDVGRETGVEAGGGRWRPSIRGPALFQCGEASSSLPIPCSSSL